MDWDNYLESDIDYKHDKSYIYDTDNVTYFIKEKLIDINNSLYFKVEIHDFDTSKLLYKMRIEQNKKLFTLEKTENGRKKIDENLTKKDILNIIKNNNKFKFVKTYIKKTNRLL